MQKLVTDDETVKKELYIKLSCSEQDTGLEHSGGEKSSSCSIFKGDWPGVHHILELCQSRTIIMLVIVMKKVLQCFQDIHLKPSYVQYKPVVKIITTFQRKY